jgi:4-amino-4-deoxy-L-arabinose transferase-like glycosyltransferase
VKTGSGEAGPATAADGARPETHVVGRVLLVFALTLAIRAAVYPVNEYVHGDAVSRVEFALDWAQSPHLIRSFGDGAAQYGPLQIYLVGTALQWIDRNDAARVVNIVFGVLTVLPVWVVTRRYFGERAAMWAGLACAAWGLHVQASTTGGSEALALCLMWVAFAACASWLERPRVLPLVASAAAMNLAAATRYDAWMYAPLLAVMPLVVWRDWQRAIAWGTLFGLLCLPYPLFWLYGNFSAHGSAFYPFTYINDFHRAWAAVESAGWREIWFRIQGLTFWPAMALFTLTPGVAVLGGAGMVAAWRERPATRWLVLAAVVPTTYYSLRSAVLLDFVPLARFGVVQMSLLLPFVAPGLPVVVRWLGGLSPRRIVGASVAMAVVLPLAIGAITFRRDTRVADILKSVSPVSTNHRAVMAAADVLRQEVLARGRSVALDMDPMYLDIQLGFYARVGKEAPRMRWPGFREHVTVNPPDYLVTFERGALGREPWVTVDGSTLTLGEARYEAVPGFGSPVALWRARPR